MEIPCVLISASQFVSVKTHAKVVRSLLKHQALVTDKHVQFPFSFAIIEMIRGRQNLAYVKHAVLWTRFSIQISMSAYVIDSVALILTLTSKTFINIRNNIRIG